MGRRPRRSGVLDRALRRLLAPSAHHLAASTALDFGCGTGLLTEQLVAGGAEVWAVDTSPAMLDILKAKGQQAGWTTVHTSIEVPAEPAAFDLIVCSSVCGFLDDYPQTAARLANRLRPGGLFVQWDWERTGDGDEHGLPRDEISDALVGAGLEGVEVQTAFEVRIDDQVMAPLQGHGRRPA